MQRISSEWFEKVAFATKNPNLHCLFIEEYFFCQDFNSVKSMGLSHGAGLVLVSVDGGWNACWMRWLSWEWQCWDPH